MLVGASRESVTSAFGRLRAEGVVWTERRTITIDWSAFEEPEPADPPLPELVPDALG